MAINVDAVQPLKIGLEACGVTAEDKDEVNEPSKAMNRVDSIINIGTIITFSNIISSTIITSLHYTLFNEFITLT